MSEKRKNKKSKEEIAKQFDLPERQSKIATIMKQDGQVYCICRSSDCSRFMIACDNCEEWYHGDCINVTEKESKHIRQYYCYRCKQENPELQTVFRIEKIKDGNGSHSNSDQDRRKKQNTHHQQQGEIDGCGFCSGCNTSNCGNCSACQSRLVNCLMPHCELRKCLQTSINDTNSIQIDQQQLSRNNNNERAYKRSREKLPRERIRKRKRSPSPEVFINPDLEGNRQCYGPGCVQNARPQSKYCSDECGICLATARIFQVLPNRLQEYGLSNTRAEEENKKQLDQIRSKQALVSFALTELDRRHQELDLVVENAKHTTLDPNALENSEAYEDEQSMYCFTCGHEIHSRFAVKHMEKCFNKYESQASFGSIFKTRVEGQPMFCDFYNAASKTYCKRLRVLCPEHCKDAKVNDNDVCGCPLVSNVFSLTGEFCRAPKKKCFKHYVWEKIRRAEIDMERVSQWVKMDELLEQERQVRHQMASRAGVLNLMLHSTYDHDVMEKLCRAQKQQILAAQKQKELLILIQQQNPEHMEIQTSALQQQQPQQQIKQTQSQIVKQPIQQQQYIQDSMQISIPYQNEVEYNKMLTQQDREKQMLLQQQKQQKILQQQKQHHVKLKQQLQYLKQQQQRQQQSNLTQQHIILQPLQIENIRQQTTAPPTALIQGTTMNSPPKHIIYTSGVGGGSPKTKTIL